MNDTKILQAVLDKVTLIETKMDAGFKEVRAGFTKLEERIDKIGFQAAELEDDTPTIEEFENLEKRVDALEKRSASV